MGAGTHGSHGAVLVCRVSPHPTPRGSPSRHRGGKSAAPRGPEARPVLPGSSLPGSGSCLHLPRVSASVSPRLGSPAPPAWPSAGVMLLGGSGGCEATPMCYGGAGSTQNSTRRQGSAHPFLLCSPPRGSPRRVQAGTALAGFGGSTHPPMHGGSGPPCVFWGVFTPNGALCRGRLVFPAMAPALGGGGSMGGWSLGAHATGCWVGFGS